MDCESLGSYKLAGPEKKTRRKMHSVPSSDKKIFDLGFHNSYTSVKVQLEGNGV